MEQLNLPKDLDGGRKNKNNKYLQQDLDYPIDIQGGRQEKKHQVAASHSPQLNINASHGFLLLRYLKIDGTDPRVLGLEFGVGSMPKLEELVLMFKAAEKFDQTSEDLFFGIKNLSHLVSIKCEIDCFPLRETIVEVFEDAIQKAVRAYPNHPRLTILKRSL